MITVTDPLTCDLTRALLVAQKLPRLIAGDSWALRMKAFYRDVSAINLTGGHVVMTVRPSDVSLNVLVARTLGVAVAGSSPTAYQIALDDQTTDNGSSGVAGRGWFCVRFGAGEVDAAALLAAVGTRRYDVRIRLATGDVRTFLRGNIEIERPITRPMPEGA